MRAAWILAALLMLLAGCKTNGTPMGGGGTAVTTVYVSGMT